MTMPYIVSQAVWTSKEASQTIELDTEFQRNAVVIIEITAVAFSGTLDIQGKLHEISAYSNIPYIRQDQASIQVPSVTQISYTLDTGTYRYAILGYWRRLQLVMTRSAGAISGAAVGSSSAKLFPYLPTKLIANSGVDIGDVDVTSIATGTNAIGRVGHDKTGIGDGRKEVDTAGTRVALASSTAAKVVIITAETDNTSIVVVGGATVVAALATRRGTPLLAGDSVTLEIDNLVDVYIDAMVSTEGVTYTYLT